VGGYWVPSQPGYHADATTLFEELLKLLGSTTGSAQRCVGRNNAQDGAEKTKRMATKLKGRYIARAWGMKLWEVGCQT
jgi:hypothetical protein